MTDAVQESHNIQVTTTISLFDKIEDKLSLNIYRVVKELINNSLKHANATQIRIEMSQVNNEYLSLIFEDNGTGFNALTVSKGIGLQNIRSRVERLKVW